MDEFDIKLLNALQAEGRLTNNELADRIGLSASQCSRRRAALEESGVIESYHAVLAAEAVGLDVLVFIQVGLATHSPDSAQAFVRLIGGIEEVQEAFSLTGDADYLVKMAVPDLKTLSRILNDVFLPHRSVARVHSYVVLDRVKQTTRLPLRYLSEAHGTQGGRPRTSATRKRLAKRPAKSPQLRVGNSAAGNRRADPEKG
jgi:DNA-binding Lrp family transcriptional regulator